MADLGNDPEAYKFNPPWNAEQRTYELKTNQTADDYSAIRDLCHTVGTASDDDFECARGRVRRRWFSETRCG